MAEAVKEAASFFIKKNAKGLGFSFWLPVLWLVLVAMGAGSAHIWKLPAFDQMDWDHPAAPPGTRSEISVSVSEGQKSDLPFIYRLGTDTMGRDILTRLIFGARISLAVGLVAPFFGFLLGGSLGILAGYFRGRFESLVVATMDVILAFPGLVLLMAISFYLGPGVMNLIAALAFLTVPAFCRVARANTLTWAQRDFVLAAKAVGAGHFRIIVGHILPNILMPMLAYGMLLVAVMIVAEGALSFLGLGVPAPTPSWGGMISEGREVLDQAPHVSLIPAGVMFLTVLSFNLIGDRVRERNDRKICEL